MLKKYEDKLIGFIGCISAAVVMGLAGQAWAEYEVITVQNGGTIQGVATWTGKVPDIDPLQVLADLDVCGATVPSPVLQIDPTTKGLKFTLVYLEKVEKGKAPEQKYMLHMGKSDDRPNSQLCNFEEHIFPFVHTQTVGIINYDQILHNPHFFSDKGASLLNLAMPTPNLEVDHTILREHGVGWLYRCDVHAHMNGYTAGFDHPYFALTDASGKYEIKDVPPGQYTLIAWHESYKVKHLKSGRPEYGDPQTMQKDIEVKPGGTVEVNWSFPVKE